MYIYKYVYIYAFLTIGPKYIYVYMNGGETLRTLDSSRQKNKLWMNNDRS